MPATKTKKSQTPKKLLKRDARTKSVQVRLTTSEAKALEGRIPRGMTLTGYVTALVLKQVPPGERRKA